MSIVKNYTDIPQSFKLAKILPIESADGFWKYHNKLDSEGNEWEGYEDYPRAEPYLEYTRKENEWEKDKADIPCWSLTALLNILPKEIKIDEQRYTPCLFPVKSKWLLKLWYNSNYIITSPIAIFSDDPVDAYYKMILKLYEFKLL